MLHTQYRRAQLALALCIHLAKHGLTGRQALADELDVSTDYIEQITLMLKKDGIVDTTRGRYGGAYLNVDPETLSAAEICSAVGYDFKPKGKIRARQAACMKVAEQLLRNLSSTVAYRLRDESLHILVAEADVMSG